MKRSEIKCDHSILYTEGRVSPSPSRGDNRWKHRPTASLLVFAVCSRPAVGQCLHLVGETAGKAIALPSVWGVAAPPILTVW